MFEARKISLLSGMTPRSGIERISSTSSMLSISPEFERPGSKRVSKQVLVHLLAALSPQRLGIEEADDPVGIAHRGDFRVGDDDRLVRVPHRQKRASLDARRTVAENVVERLAQFADDPLDAVGGQRILVARLRGREQVQSVDALIADQRLRELGVALRHIDKVKDDAPLRAHHQIEIAQPDVEIDDADAPSALGERDAKRRGRGGFAYTTLS